MMHISDVRGKLIAFFAGVRQKKLFGRDGYFLFTVEDSSKFRHDGELETIVVRSTDTNEKFIVSIEKMKL